MATLSHSESRRLYSWWWDSHISPKNSKWLQENLSDMDSKVKAMIKIIEEDADSFAKRAEMYYRRRPELMSLMEEIYRAYRALAERYDHAQGALRQAHQTMAEAFPDQIPLEFDDEPSGISPSESELHDLDTDRRISPPFNTADLKKNSREYEMLQKEISRLSEENQNLKNRIKSQSERTDEAESQVFNLKETLSKLESEKEAALLQWQQSSSRLSNLKAEISHTEKEFAKLKEEMQHGLKNLKSSEHRCLVLERANESLQLELDKLKQRAKEQQEELNEKQAELEKLSISIQEEKLKSMQADMARLSMEKLLQDSQEKMRLWALEIQGEAGKLKDMEMNKVRLERELEKIREEYSRLNEQNKSSTLRIIDLQDEIIFLKDVKGKLEDEVSVHVEEKKVLQKQLSRLKEDKNNSEWRHCSLMEQVSAVTSNVESLQALAKELRDGNVELKDIINNHEGVSALHVENLKQLQKMSEKNAALEISLSDANIELERLRKKKKKLEDSCEYLNSKVSTHQSERAVLVSQIDFISQNMEKLSVKNIYLENSLSDANIELESLRGKLKELEESCQSLCDQNSMLLGEKRNLVSEVESITQILGNLERKYAELQSKHSNLEREKDLALDQVTELQKAIKLEREENANVATFSKSQISDLEKQILLLQVEGRRREQELEVEQQKIINAQFEIFILQRCLSDMKEKNLVISANLQKHQELKEKYSSQEGKIGSLLKHNEKLAEGVRLILKVLKLDERYDSLEDLKDEIILQLILHEIRYLLNTISDAQDVKQNQLLEKSVVVTLLEHFQQEVAELRSEKNMLKKEAQTKTEELSVLKTENNELLKMNEQIWQKMKGSNEKVEELKSEMKFLLGQLTELQDSRRSLQTEIIKLLEENSSLLNKLHDIREKEKALEEQYHVILADAMTLECLKVAFKSLYDERVSDLKSVHKKLSQANQKFQQTEATNLELCRNLDEAKLVREELVKSITILSEDNKNREHEIACICKANELSRQEVHELQKQVDELRSKEKELASEQQKGIDVVRSCDVEIATLLSNIQFATINAALFKEKILELIIVCESFEISSMVQKEVLKEEITQRNSYVHELKEKLDAIEVENRRLKVDLDGGFTLLGSLQDDVAILEEQTLLLAKDHIPLDKPKSEENTLVPFQHSKNSQKPSEDHNATALAGNLELQKLHATVKALQKVVMDTGILLEQERLDFNSSLSAARKQIEMLKLKEILDDDLNDVKYERMLKDIQLDLVQNSSQNGNNIHSHGQKKPEKAVETNDQMLELWGIVGSNSDNPTKNARSARMQHEIKHPITEPEEKDKGKRPSTEIISVKELVVDKQELPKRIALESHQDFNKRFIERLSSDAQRLMVLQSSIQELKENIEASEESKSTSRLDGVKAQLKEVEGTVWQLIDAINKLTKKAEDCASSSENITDENVDWSRRSQRKISERARKVSEKIGRLELELQKIHHVFLKLDEEQANKRNKTMHRRSKVLLVEYLYGKSRDSRRKKRGLPCGCLNPKKTEGD
ncbi:protein NETWORKED 1A-like [Ananas comosus]|uniref:Protein NETWORKED 1A-like n=1 Tax=Ananas comosus TaxID=4615 RepID=A0A6P5FH55_ANACO|nr:protein NETWORKED 1A-like [Ananas comosus]XP_020092804.1 protein NETWORKED 1A-like [Ananas comosus]